MSFMYNPFPFDDPKPVNRPEISEETISSIVEGDTATVARKFAAPIIKKAESANQIVAFDGYTTARWEYFINVLGRECKAAGLEFLVRDIHHLDMGTLLDRLGIAVRTGHHCAQPLMDRLGIQGTVRASFALYNTKEEIDILANGIARVSQMF